jgi:alpha-ketoglutarate-dependent taurine dioxygenase
MQCLSLENNPINIPELPVNFSRNIANLAKILDKKIDKNTTNIHENLKSIIDEKYPKLFSLGTEITKILDSEVGFVILRNLPFLLYKRPLQDLLFLAISTVLGNITVHDDAQKIVWEVTPRTNIIDRKPTFSELNTEAPLHTDSAFIEQPEEYFGLFVVNAAKTGGDSILISIKKVLEQLNQSYLGAKCLTILRNNIFPFHIPPAFANNQTNIIKAPIINDSPLIRFRLDTIFSGFRYCPELASYDSLWAINYFNSFLESFQDKLVFKLNEGDLIFVNNHTMLHGRTAFKDNNRLLLRIRVRKNTINKVNRSAMLLNC